MIKRLFPNRSFNNKLFQAIYKLDNQLEGLEDAISKLKDRDQEILQKCIGAQVTKDDAYAKVYANECVEIRKMVKLGISSQLALEKATIRLQRIAEFKDVLRNLTPVMSILNETQSRLSDFVPEIATGIGEANTMLDELSSNVTVPNPKNLETTKSNEEVKKVLEESSILAEQRLKDQFPELPEILSSSNLKSSSVALTADGEEVSIPDQVFEYLKQQDGRLSISDIASKLEIPPKDVRKAIECLEKEGKIIVEK